MSGFLGFPLSRTGILTRRPHATDREPNYTLHDQDEQGNERETRLYVSRDLLPRFDGYVGKLVRVTGQSLSPDHAYMQVSTFLGLQPPSPGASAPPHP